MTRRNFTRNQREQIVERAKRNGIIHCEGCGLSLGQKPYEIDHIIAEGLRPEADKKKPITIAEGQLLGKECCHRGEAGKTNKDVARIAKAKRQADRHLGIKRPKQSIRSAGFPSTGKTPRITRNQLPPKKLFREVNAE